VANIYDINFNNQARWNLAHYLRKVRMLAFIKILVFPFIVIYQDVMRFRKATLYDLMITPQVCYLEAMLNDRYDFVLRRIYIDEVEEFPPLYLYRRDEEKPVFIYRRSEAQPVYLYTRAEGALHADDFIVMVPNDISFNQLEMRSLVYKKRLPGMKFKIQLF
jgi:hypothetical protein